MSLVTFIITPCASRRGKETTSLSYRRNITCATSYDSAAFNSAIIHVNDKIPHLSLRERNGILRVCALLHMHTYAASSASFHALIKTSKATSMDAKTAFGTFACERDNGRASVRRYRLRGRGSRDAVVPQCVPRKIQGDPGRILSPSKQIFMPPPPQFSLHLLRKR